MPLFQANSLQDFWENTKSFSAWTFNFTYSTVDALIAFLPFGLIRPATQILYDDEDNFLRRAYTNFFGIISLFVSSTVGVVS